MVLATTGDSCSNDNSTSGDYTTAEGEFSNNDTISSLQDGIQQQQHHIIATPTTPLLQQHNTINTNNNNNSNNNNSKKQHK